MMNGIRHRAASARQVRTALRGNCGVRKSSRMAKRYAMPATVRAIRKDGVPKPRREQIVSDVDVVERNGGPHRQPQFASSHEQRIQGIRCPHISAGKETWIRGRSTNE